MPAAKHLAPLTPLQQRWTTLYTTTLPKLASSHAPVQGKAEKGKWPVTLDHCFARIILDNAVGIDKPWPKVLASPATRNMNQKQLQACIELAEKIKDGNADLWALDAKSLALRGKPAKKHGVSSPQKAEKKRKSRAADDENDNSTVQNGSTAASQGSPATKKSRKQEAGENWSAFSLLKDGQAADEAGVYPAIDEEELELLGDIRHIIATSADLTPFRRDTLILLTQVPRGRYTTYQALANAMDKRQALDKNAQPRKGGCARAIGMAMRTNPFAPTVPCHRCLASDGTVGGFKGDWGKEGKFYSEKIRLLGEEGVRFDSRGKVVGKPFTNFDVVF